MLRVTADSAPQQHQHRHRTKIHVNASTSEFEHLVPKRLIRSKVELPRTVITQVCPGDCAVLQPISPDDARSRNFLDQYVFANVIELIRVTTRPVSRWKAL